jgi:muconate cycloisomerase
MAIARVETVRYALPFREPYVTAVGRLERRELLLVRLTDHEGAIGIGEAAPLALRGGPAIGQIADEIRASGGEVGEGLSAQARAALEMARLDLEGRRAGEPVWRLLGARGAEPVPCNATLVAADPPAVAADAARWAALGFETFKLKVGGDRSDDAGQVAAVRAELGTEARIRVDANATWEVPAAIERLREMEPHGLELAEQPAAGLDGLKLVSAATSIPIAADESVTSPRDARMAAEHGACDLATAKLAKVGGIGAALEIAAQLPTYLSSALDGPVGIAAAAHAAQALYGDAADPGLAHGLATQLLFAETVAGAQCEVRDGMLHLPEGPGLGVEIDADALERCRI